MGLPLRLPLQRTPRPRPRRLLPLIQPTPTTYLTRRPPTDQPRLTGLWVPHLAEGVGFSGAHEPRELLPRFAEVGVERAEQPGREARQCRARGDRCAVAAPAPSGGDSADAGADGGEHDVARHTEELPFRLGQGGPEPAVEHWPL